MRTGPFGAFVLLGCLWLVGCATSARPEAPAIDTAQGSRDAVIRHRYVESGGMWMREYELTVRGSGEVTFRGKYGLRELGPEQEWSVPPEDVGRLVHDMLEVGFLELGSDYGRDPNRAVVDSSSTVTELTLYGQTKRVSRMIRDEASYTPEEWRLAKLGDEIQTVAQAGPRISRACFPGYAGKLP